MVALDDGIDSFLARRPKILAFHTSDINRNDRLQRSDNIQQSVTIFPSRHFFLGCIERFPLRTNFHPFELHLHPIEGEK